MARARRPTETCSPVETTTSCSRWLGRLAREPVSLSRRFVSPAIALTTTTTSLPAFFAARARRATLRMRSTSPTLVPPYFWTTRALPERGIEVPHSSEEAAASQSGSASASARGAFRLEGRPHAHRPRRKVLDARAGRPGGRRWSTHRNRAGGARAGPRRAQARRPHRRERRADVRDQYRLRDPRRGLHRPPRPAAPAAQPHPLPCRRRGI